MHISLFSSNWTVQEERLHPCPFGCLNNGQTDPPWISREYSTDRWFLLKKHNSISLSFYAVPFRRTCPPKTSLPNQQKIPPNGGISILGNVPIGLFKKPNDGLRNLSVSPCYRRRNEGKIIWDHRRDWNKSPPHPLNDCTKLQVHQAEEGVEYWLKVSMPMERKGHQYARPGKITAAPSGWPVDFVIQSGYPDGLAHSI